MENPDFKIPPLPDDVLDAIPTKYLNIPYCNQSPAQKLDIYIPKNANKPFPVIVHFHGGAFMLGTRRDDNLVPMLRALEHGYAVVSVEYRLSGEARFPALIWDSKAAIRFLRAHAQTYGFDSQKIAAWGPSAGGYIVAMLGLTVGNPAFEDLTQGNPTVGSEVQAVVDWCGPCGGFLNMDTAITANGIGCADHNAPDSPESRLMGAPIETIPQLVALANPCRYVHRGVPPFLIQHGANDPVVPVQQSQALADTIKAVAGEDKVDFKIYQGHGHHGEAWYNTVEMSNSVFRFLDSVFKR